MPTPYTEWRWFWPPRTKMKVPFKPDSPIIKMWAKFPDSTAQLKFNGSRNLIAVSPEGDVRFWTRHRAEEGKGEPLEQGTANPRKLYQIAPEMKDRILAMSGKGHWTVFDSELLHYKTITVKDTVVLWDVLVWESQHLLGVPLRQRYELLLPFAGTVLKSFRDVTYGGQGEPESESVVVSRMGRNNLFLAENFTPDKWVDGWELAKRYSFVEGLVLKRQNASLSDPFRELNNEGWMCRCRKPHKNYQY